MGTTLLRRVIDSKTLKQSRLIDLGCGTGELLQALESNGFRNLNGLDLSSQMIAIASQKAASAKFHHASIEELPFDERSFDVVISNAAIQWCDTRRAASEMFRVLKDRGKILTNVFTGGTLRQWHEAFISSGYPSRVHALADANEVESAFTAAGFSELKINRHREASVFDSIKSMFDSIRKLGATNATSSRSQPMSRAEYMALRSHFQQRLESDGKLLLDFEWIQIEAQKKLGSPT